MERNPKSTRPSVPLLVQIGRQIPPNTITETISVICKKHWFSLAQTLMAPQPKPKNEAEDCQGSKINIIMAPRDNQKHLKRAKRPHKRPYVRQNDARRRDLKARRRELKARRRDLKARRRDLKARSAPTKGDWGAKKSPRGATEGHPRSPRGGRRPPQRAACGRIC